MTHTASVGSSVLCLFVIATLFQWLAVAGLTWNLQAKLMMGLLRLASPFSPRSLVSNFVLFLPSVWFLLFYSDWLFVFLFVSKITICIAFPCLVDYELKQTVVFGEGLIPRAWFFFFVAVFVIGLLAVLLIFSVLAFSLTEKNLNFVVSVLKLNWPTFWVRHLSFHKNSAPN